LQDTITQPPPGVVHNQKPHSMQPIYTRDPRRIPSKYKDKVSEPAFMRKLPALRIRSKHRERESMHGCRLTGEALVREWDLVIN
jgi:hypothetical protein